MTVGVEGDNAELGATVADLTETTTIQEKNKEIKKMSWITFMLLTVFCSIPAAIYITLFTEIGFGIATFHYVAVHFDDFTKPVSLIIAVLIFLFYIFDISYWRDIPKGIGWALIFSLVLFDALFKSNEVPLGPLCMFGMFIPIWLVCCQEFFFKKTETRVFISWLTGPFILTSVLVLISWVVWVFVRPDVSTYSKEERNYYSTELGCKPDFTEHPNCKNPENEEDVCFVVHDSTLFFPQNCDPSCIEVFKGCINFFVVWQGPIFLACLYFFYGYFCNMLRPDGSVESELKQFMKLWMFLLISIYATASLVGAGEGISRALAALSLFGFISSTTFLAVSFSREEHEENMDSVLDSISTKMGNRLNVWKGLLVLTCAPATLVYIALSFLNQCIRKTGFPSSKKLKTDEEKKLMLTKRASRQMAYFQSWQLSKIYVYAVYFGLGFIVLQVIVQKLMNVFMSWLIEKTAALELWEVSLLMVGIGVLMFLIPIIPGPPIYITTGIIMTGSAMEKIGLIGSILYASALSLTMKLISSSFQMQVVGRGLANKVSVRKFVSINSDTTRGIKLLLSSPGLSAAKVSILCGGPDWPTSVLCGILRLNYFQVMLGTIPVIGVVTLSVATGSLTLVKSLTDDEGKLKNPWASPAKSAVTALTAVVIVLMITTATKNIARVHEERADEISEMPYDDEVMALEEKELAFSEMYEEVTQWKALPLSAKLFLGGSLTCIIISIHIIFIGGNKCFEPYEITDTINGTLGGDWTTLFKPLGKISMYFLIASLVLLFIFKKWASNKTKKLLTEGHKYKVVEDSPENDECVNSNSITSLNKLETQPLDSPLHEEINSDP